ncbi:methionine ABC transporter permease [Klebsiella michiganensis]|uniref:D-methionine transport system permease protein MetI n=2 Tax=Klebsiella TaxID=570 RepID=A0A7H4N711_9ENTR|nr:methionine ABC transporter permease [Klebsiella michiganensis]
MSEPMIWLLVRGVWETLAMTFVSGFFGFVLGLPVGVLLYVTRPGQIVANAKLYRTLSAVVNIFRSIPFIILLVWMIPFTRVIVGTSIGLQAAIVPLTVGAAPFIARMVENALLEIPTGLIEASRAMGATPMQIVRKVLLPEALPGSGECGNHHAHYAGRLFRDGRRRGCRWSRADWLSVRLYRLQCNGNEYRTGAAGYSGVLNPILRRSYRPGCDSQITLHTIQNLTGRK